MGRKRESKKGEIERQRRRETKERQKDGGGSQFTYYTKTIGGSQFTYYTKTICQSINITAYSYSKKHSVVVIHVIDERIIVQAHL